MPKLFLHGQHVCNHLGGMELISKAIPYRDAGMFCQFLDDFLPKPPVFNAVKHPAQNPGGVCYALFLANLGARRIKVCNMHPQIIGRHFKGTAGSGACLLKNQRNILAF